MIVNDLEGRGAKQEDVTLTLAVLSVLLVLAMLALSGCGTTTKYFIADDEGQMRQVAKIEQDSPGGATYEQDKEGNVKVSTDTRQPSWWDRYVAPIFVGAASKTDVQAGI